MTRLIHRCFVCMSPRCRLYARGWLCVDHAPPPPPVPDPERTMAALRARKAAEWAARRSG